MNTYLKFLFQFRWYIAVIVPLVIIAFSFQLKNIEIEGSYRIWFKDSSSLLSEYDRFKDDFSSDDSIVIAFKDPKTIFNKKALSSINRITSRLKESLYIEKVSTLINYQYIHVDEKESSMISVNNFIENIGLLTDEELNDKKNIAVQEQGLVNSYISNDGKTTMIIARLGFNYKDKNSTSLIKYIDRVLSKESKITGYKYWINGSPSVVDAMIEIAKSESGIFTPLIFLILIILLFVFFRRISGVLLPLSIVFLSILVVMSYQILLGYKFNTFTMNIPIFIIAIGIADAIHVYSQWLADRKLGVDNYSSVENTLKKNFKPIMFTSITTVIGFGSLIFSEILPISTLGIATSSAAICAFILSIFWMPAILLLLKKQIYVSKIKKINKYKWNYGQFIVCNYKKIITLFLLCIGLLSLGLFNLKVDTNMILAFDQKTEIRKSSNFIMDNLTGIGAYEMILDSGEIDGIKNPKFLHTLVKFYSDYKQKFPKNIRNLKSIKKIIEKYNKIWNNDMNIPDSKKLISQYLLLYNMSVPKGKDITDMIDFNQQKLRVNISVNLVETSQNLKMINYIKKWWLDTDYKVTVTGKMVITTYLESEVTNTIIYSLGITLIMVTLMMLIIFKRISILWILIIPNLLPVILVLGLMGWLKMNIDMGVAITGAIIIGVAIDDTIHFMFKYFEAKKVKNKIEDILNEVFMYAGKAIFFTTIALSISFGILIFSDFLPNKNFAIVTSSALIIALVLDLFLLPSLLFIFDKDIKGKTNECINKK
jgi:predicted RND superfamily exporter protein